ncbi:chemotaxis protein CheW [Curvibacter sp. RS43]|uniref:Chemotaxis protein CheW n=1 Tax=Curvibacter microcysteis TaxID=3026419 RepID=A0ABT5MEH5_9BURK|nr:MULTISPECIES: chemotaxis protein CheW [unclassified Curvibacter]MDD0809604.1 chemotaxis protein CheW [Curvibacter sp. RS43]MDD0814780.1 chemotaxis protein CheW [Curvibacter sp. HBC28]
MNTSTLASQHGQAAAPQEFLAFKLGSEEYGMDILHVQEIRSYEPPTKLPNASSFIKGVVNLRGIIVPIVDMRLRFSLEHVAYNDLTVVVVVALGDKVWGLVVDAVSDVIELSPAQIKPLPDFSSAVDSDYLTGMGSVDQRMVILLDAPKLLAGMDTRDVLALPSF